MPTPASAWAKVAAVVLLLAVFPIAGLVIAATACTGDLRAIVPLGMLCGAIAVFAGTRSATATRISVARDVMLYPMTLFVGVLLALHLCGPRWSPCLVESSWGSAGLIVLLVVEAGIRVLAVVVESGGVRHES